MSRYSRKTPVQPRAAAPKPEPTIPEGKTAVTHKNKPGWLGYIWETPWNLSGHADVVWIKSPVNPTTEKPEPLPLFPRRYPIADLIEQSTPEQEGAVSGEIWGQGNGLEDDRLAVDPQGVSKAKNQGLRTIIAGSRSVQSLEVVEQAIAESGFQISEVVSGTANGPDKLGEQWAAKHGISVKQFPADWDTHGKKAGYLRNSEMAQYAEAAIAIWDGQSRGTAHMISEAERLGLKVFVFCISAQETGESNPLLKHTCHAIGCDREIAPKFLMCPKHWDMVPKPLQAKVYRLYRPGQEIDKKPTPEYLQVMKEAIAVVHQQESGAEETGELIRVVNIKHVKGQKLPNLIVAMQSKGHPLGNPFYKEAKSDRTSCTRKFKQWLWQRYQEQGSEQRKAVEAIADLVMAGEQVNLACCCKQPDVFVACHCDEIKNLLEKVVIPQRLEVAA